MLKTPPPQQYDNDRSFREIAWFSAIHDLPEIITGDVQTCTISDEDKRAKELVEAAAASLLGVILPAKLANEIALYEQRDGVFRQGFARTVDKLGPTAVDYTGRRKAGLAGMAIYGIIDPLKFVRNVMRLTHSKRREFGERQPELVGAYYEQGLQWIDRADLDSFADTVRKFRPINATRIVGHETCARCQKNDEQYLGVPMIDLEKTPQAGVEAEKKFRVSSDAVDELITILNDPVEITQIYLSDEINLRVRKVVDKTGNATYFATFKGEKSVDENGNVVRQEVECEIDPETFEVFAARELPRIEKTRYRNKLLPGVTLDVFRNTDDLILESENVDGISNLRRHLIQVFQQTHVKTNKIFQSTKEDVDNQKIAVRAFGDGTAQYVHDVGGFDKDSIVKRIFIGAANNGGDTGNELRGVVQELASNF